MNITVTLSILIAILADPGLTSAPHKFEDGFVERTFAVIVHDQTAQAKYAIGLNEATILELLAQWEATDRTNKDASQKDKSQKPTRSTNPSEFKQQPEIEPQRPTQQDSKAENNPAAPEQKPASTEPSPNPKKAQPKSADTNENKEDEKEENLINAETFARFQKVAPEQIAKRIKILCDEKTVPVKNVSLDPSPNHPFVLLVKFEFEIPAKETFQLEIQDENFSKQTGAVRRSLKTQGNAMLLNSNVAPIIIRSKRVELAGLSAKETAQQTSISAKLAIMSNSDTDK